MLYIIKSINKLYSLYYDAFYRELFTSEDEVIKDIIIYSSTDLYIVNSYDIIYRLYLEELTSSIPG